MQVKTAKYAVPNVGVKLPSKTKPTQPPEAAGNSENRTTLEVAKIV
ncbi:MAG: hypothetical protein FWC74_09455 [Candidatus Bathyarchaeota archaeon]|nr:hypothetical protein [Candidatus Termitimicrobium sp.]